MGCVPDLWGSSTRFRSARVCLAALAVIGFVSLCGCGGGSSSSTAGTGPAADAANGTYAPSGGTGETSASPPPSARHRSTSRRSGDDAAGGGRHRGASEDHEGGDQSAAGDRTSAGNSSGASNQAGAGNVGRETGGSGAKTPQASLAGASPVAVRKLRKHCPKEVDKATCADLVKAFIASQGSESQPVASPEECTKTRTKAECEAVLPAQAAAAEGESVGVQECLAHMTPQCEAILRPIFESQSAAQAGGE
jgi:hypothetical protein